MTTWMIVEDEPDVYDMLLAMSEVLGHEGVAFVDGEEAVAWIDDVDSGKFQGKLPSLALVDVRLPNEITGPQVGARLRKSPVMKTIPIVLMTAYKLTPRQERALKHEAGSNLILYKPLPRMAELQSILNSLVTPEPSGVVPSP